MATNEITNQITNQITKIDKQVLKIQMLGFPGVVLLGLAMYGMIADGNALLPFLNVENIRISMIVIGAGIAGWVGTKTYPLLKQKAQLKENAGT